MGRPLGGVPPHSAVSAVVHDYYQPGMLSGANALRPSRYGGARKDSHSCKCLRSDIREVQYGELLGMVDRKKDAPTREPIRPVPPSDPCVGSCGVGGSS